MWRSLACRIFQVSAYIGICVACTAAEVPVTPAAIAAASSGSAGIYFAAVAIAGCIMAAVSLSRRRSRKAPGLMPALAASGRWLLPLLLLLLVQPVSGVAVTGAAVAVPILSADSASALGQPTTCVCPSPVNVLVPLPRPLTLTLTRPLTRFLARAPCPVPHAPCPMPHGPSPVPHAP